MMAYEYSQYAEQVPTLQDVAAAGFDVNAICVEFAAIGSCPRGDSCRWVHACV
jgi:hypothetical protein